MDIIMQNYDTDKVKAEFITVLDQNFYQSMKQPNLEAVNFYTNYKPIWMSGPMQKLFLHSENGRIIIPIKDIDYPTEAQLEIDEERFRRILGEARKKLYTEKFEEFIFSVFDGVSPDHAIHNKEIIRNMVHEVNNYIVRTGDLIVRGVNKVSSSAEPKKILKFSKYVANKFREKFPILFKNYQFSAIVFPSEPSNTQKRILSTEDDLVIDKISSYMIDNIYGGIDYKEIFSEYSVKSSTDYLILSVNPSDFLTMSLGNSWGSCMTPDGGYSAGIFSYLTSKNSFLAYTVSEDDIVNGKMEKPSTAKIWREICYLDWDRTNAETIIFLEQKHYPSVNRINSTLVRLVISQILGREMVGINNLSIRGKGVDFGYNDFNHGVDPFYNGALVLPQDTRRNIENLSFTVHLGESRLLCWACGNNNDSDEPEDGGVCDNCCDRRSCHNCGDTIYSEDIGGTDDMGNDICEYCIDNEYVWIDRIDVFVHRDGLEEIFRFSYIEFSYDWDSEVVEFEGEIYFNGEYDYCDSPDIVFCEMIDQWIYKDDADYYDYSYYPAGYIDFLSHIEEGRERMLEEESEDKE